MNRKEYFVAAIVLNTALMTFAACLCHELPGENEDAGGARDSRATTLNSLGAKFGPVIETVLPAAKTEEPQMLDLETGRVQPQKPFEHFNFRADAIMAWIRSNGLDISCNVWSTGAACVTYDMSVVAVTGKCWEGATEEELRGNPALAPKRHSPRRLLVLGQNRPDTYIFRTGEGTLGILQIVGLSSDGQGVKIRYKLIRNMT
jgi:hypothetical protein